MERRLTDDEPELVLPPLDGDEEEEAVAAPADDADLELDTLKEGEEIGLDEATGDDDPCDLSELIGASDRDESERWTPDSEAAEDLQGAEPDLVEGEEEGWIEGSESAEEEDGGEPESIIPLPADASQEDGGEEGIEEREPQDGRAEGEDETALPPLGPDGKEGGDDGGDEEEEEAFGRKLLDEMADKDILDE
jgi:hypothetical protein